MEDMRVVDAVRFGFRDGSREAYAGIGTLLIGSAEVRKEEVERPIGVDVGAGEGADDEAAVRKSGRV